MLNAAAPDATTLVFVPGAMCPPEIFTETAEILQIHSLAAPWLEWPGPWSIHDAAARLVASTRNLSDMVFVGHSVGAAIAILAAHSLLKEESAQRLRGLVICNSGANTRGHGDLDTLIDTIVDEWGLTFWQKFVTRCVATELTASMRTTMLQYPAKFTPEAIVEVMVSQRETDLVPILPALAGLPTLIVHGYLDESRSIQHAREFESLIPHSTLRIVEAGHTPPVERPELFAREVADFLASAHLDGPRATSPPC
jgi:pimeloyl-ACP methyl ester carboxylesterase